MTGEKNPTEAGAVADVAAIARGLSATMQRVVLAFPPEARSYLDIGWARSWPEIASKARCTHGSIRACMERGLVEQSEWKGQGEFRYLTPLGLAVHQHLSEQGETAGVVDPHVTNRYGQHDKLPEDSA